MSKIILYKSKHGCTKNYAQWISEEANIKSYPVDKFPQDELEKASTIILAAPVIAGRIIISSWIKSNWEKIRDKEIILFSTSAAPTDDPSLQEAFKRGFDNFENKEYKKIQYVPLAGRYIFEELGFFTRFFLKMLSKMAKNNPDLKDLTKSVDNMDKKEIKKVIDLL